jgi:hypothetical protein
MVAGPVWGADAIPEVVSGEAIAERKAVGCLRRRPASRSVAQPLNPNNKHKLIRCVHQECHKTFVMSAEM